MFSSAPPDGPIPTGAASSIRIGGRADSTRRLISPNIFDTIEINTSFYNPLRPELVAQWIERIACNPRFLFTAKLWQKFTHEEGATAADEKLVRMGFDVLHAGGRLGAVLLQFPFSFHNTERKPRATEKRSSPIQRLPAGGRGAAFVVGAAGVL